MWRRSKTLLWLLHPLPSAATVLVTLACAAFLAGGPRPADVFVKLGLMVACQQAAISLHNDWCDRHLDRLAKPERALPRGDASPAAVLAAAWALALASALVAGRLGGLEVALDVAGTGCGFAYNAWLKRTPLSWLPFAVAFPLVPLFGAAALGRWPPRWWLLFVAGVPIVLAIHLADSLPDVAQDRAAGVDGLAQRLGQRHARWVSAAAVAVAALLAAVAGLATANRATLAAAAAGAALGAAGAWRPSWHRGAITAGAVVVALGWVAAIARSPG